MHLKLPGFAARIAGMPVAGKIAAVAAVIVIGWQVVSGLSGKKTVAAAYQTAEVTRGTLVVSISGSGQVSATNNRTVTTQVSGVITELYVADGSQVKTGDKIAEIEPDLESRQTVAQALASYQSARNSLDNANAAMYTTQSDMFTQWKKYYDTATNSTYQNSDGTPNETNRALADFHILKDNWLAAEAKYKNQQNAVAQAQTALNAAWFSYQQNSATIYAPISGTVSGLSIRTGSVISPSSGGSSSTTSSSTKIASIATSAMPAVSVNLTEIDVIKVKTGNKATITFDALPDKTFTGKVASIDTSGSTSSGVTTYPALIQLDSDSLSVFPNMAASANIITDVKNDVLMVPSTAVQTQGGETVVRVMKNNQPQSVPVETGLSSDSHTEIISGLSEGDIVVTGATQPAANSSSQSPFSSFGGGAMRMGGAAIRTR